MQSETITSPFANPDRKADQMRMQLWRQSRDKCFWTAWRLNKCPLLAFTYPMAAWDTSKQTVMAIALLAFKPMLRPLALCLLAAPTFASKDIADQYPGSPLYSKPIEVIPYVWSAVGATAPPAHSTRSAPPPPCRRWPASPALARCSSGGSWGSAERPTCCSTHGPP